MHLLPYCTVPWERPFDGFWYFEEKLWMAGVISFALRTSEGCNGHGIHRSFEQVEHTLLRNSWRYFFLVNVEGNRVQIIFAEMREYFDLLYMSKLFLNPRIRLCRLQPNPFKFPILFHSVQLTRSWLMDIFLQSLWWHWTKVASSGSSTKNIYSSFITTLYLRKIL